MDGSLDLRPDLVVHSHEDAESPVEVDDLTQLSVNTIRALAMDAVEAAGSGHPGTPMALALLGHLLFTKILKHDPSDPQWPDRDRFVLSIGHASMLLYSLLHLSGYELPLDELRTFRQWGSLCPGHPERGVTPGVEVSTGPLGQGVGNAVGMAIAERMLAERFNRPGLDVVDHGTYFLCGDGDLMEGVSAEAASLAGNLHLGKLIGFYDDNSISIEGSTDLAFCEQVGKRFEAYGWQVLEVSDVNDIGQLEETIAQGDTNHPSLVIVRSVIGFGAPTKQGTAQAHGAPLGPEEVSAAKENLGWTFDEQFYVPEEVRAHYSEAAGSGRAAHASWQQMFSEYELLFPGEAEEFERILAGSLPQGWEDAISRNDSADAEASRVTSGKVLNALASAIPELVGGSADLAPSTGTYLKGYGDVACEDFGGRNFHFGVREHAMGAVMNGMLAHEGLRVFGSTFLVFSDYMKPAIRMAALMGLPAIYVFTHDSIGLGADGPTHQPVEQLAGLRSIPNVRVIRPADADETAQAWKEALGRRDGPTCLILSRQGLASLGTIPDDAVSHGAYAVAAGDDVTLVATGSEVGLAIRAREELRARGIDAGVVSMPSWDLFEQQSREYRASVIPTGRPSLAIEAGSPQGWKDFVQDVVGIDRFGASAPAAELWEHFGFTPEAVADRAAALLGDAR